MRRDLRRSTSSVSGTERWDPWRNRWVPFKVEGQNWKCSRCGVVAAHTEENFPYLPKKQERSSHCHSCYRTRPHPHALTTTNL